MIRPGFVIPDASLIRLSSGGEITTSIHNARRINMSLRDLSLLLFIIGGAVMAAIAQEPASYKRSDVVGIWRTGGMSTMADRNTITGSTTPSNGNTFKYEFRADGRFSFVGYLQSTMYGCTTALFNDKQGRFELSGSQITLFPTKNFWRNTNSCSASSTKERNYTLERETYELSTKTDEYGKSYVCLTNEKGETCYRGEKE